MNYLINNCGMKNADRFLKPISPAKIDVDAYLQLQEIKDNIVQFVEESRNLYIISHNLQTGKTTWSLKIMYKFFDEISPHTDNYELKVTFGKETLSANRYSHLDMLGNEIKIGDIGVGCSGRGSTQGLEIQQILSMSKVLINGNLRPTNFIVLKPIDGRPIKGV